MKGLTSALLPLWEILGQWSISSVEARCSLPYKALIYHLKLQPVNKKNILNLAMV